MLKKDENFSCSFGSDNRIYEIVKLEKYLILVVFHNHFSCNILSGNPVQVDINMYVRSMGPISEMDMVGALNDVILFILQSINIKSTF